VDWVETTGRSVEEAREAALDELGVAEDDAEVVVVEEPKPGLFGRVRGEARVRARVRPTQPRPKEDRRDRRRRGRAERPDKAEGPEKAERPEKAEKAERPEKAEKAERPEKAEKVARPARREKEEPAERAERTTATPSRPARSQGSRSQTTTEVEAVDEDVTLEEQGEEAVDFLNGLMDLLGLPAEVASVIVDDETVEVQVTGENLGLLIGPKGSTLASLQEITRTVVQRQLGAHHGRLLVDVASYRQKRKVALERFTAEVAEQVRSTGQRRVLEPMSAADRKIVHDAANDIEGVSTTSEGEDPHRRVIVLPVS
jgi:spoIIIJ-associated protein